MFDSFYNNFIAEDRYRMILDGLQVTLLITVGAVILGTLLGGLICWMRMSRHSSWLQKVAKVYINIMRGTPVLVVLMLMYYVIMAPLGATGIVVAIVTFGMNTAAYIGEMLRTSIQGIDRGQTEAGLALGFTPRQTFIRIVLPQVIKSVMPVYEGEVVSLLKGTSIVGYIAVADMTRASDLIRSRTFDPFLPIIVTAIIYFFMAWLIGQLLKALVEKRHLKAVAAAAGLLIGATVCYVPELFSERVKADATDAPAIFQALNGKEVGVIIGSIQDIAITEKAPGAHIQRMATSTDLIAALTAGKVDVVGGESLTLVFNKQLAERLDSVSAGLQAIPVGACFKLENTELQQDFNSFLSEIRGDGTYKKIMDRWSQADDPSALPIPEQRGNGRTIRVAAFPSQPPLSFISYGKPTGLEPDLLTEWANRRGWKLEYLIMDFASQIPAIQTGKADLAMGYISITEERKKQVLFSDGYIASEMILMTRKGELNILTDPSQPESSPKQGGKWWPWALAAILAMAAGACIVLRRKSLARREARFQTASQPKDAPIIRFSHMKKSYGALQVLKDINADVRRGEVISIIGPSGTGKSTLLRCLNLLDPPTGGEILFDAQNILAKGYPVHMLRQKMGMVFQSFNLFGHMTVLENVMYSPVKILKKSEEEAREEAIALLRKVGLADKADVYPDSLSGGQKQRVAIARCLAMSPEVILFDEPTSALDPTMVGEVLSVIRQLAKEGMTMLIVTHEMKFARDVSTRIFFMYDGYIHEDGTPDQIFNAPVHSATKAFAQRIRKEVFESIGASYDFPDMGTRINRFCIKYNIADKMEPANGLCHLLIPVYIKSGNQLTVRITYSELSGETALDFMSENDTQAPAQLMDEKFRQKLLTLCNSIVEEPTAKGFRVKLML